MREMNLSQLEIDLIYGYLMGVLLNNVNVYGTSQYGGGGYVDYGYSRPSSMDYYGNYEGGGSGGRYGGSGSESDQTNVNFNDFNYTEIEDKLTNPCFSKVLADLRAKNVYGIVGDIVKKFTNNPKSKIYFTQAAVIKKTNGDILYSGYYPSSGEIRLSVTALENASQEFIAATIIHELFHAYINASNEQIDHTKMFNDYVVPAGKYLNEKYNIDTLTAQNLFLAGLKKATGFDAIEFSPRWVEINRDLNDYLITKKKGTYCY